MSAGFSVRPTTQPIPVRERAAVLAAPGFGRYFTDHMASATWTSAAGWHDRRISAREPFSLPPGTAVLHYAQQVFEGLKAYRHPDGSIWLFRPEVNARRFARSAQRLALPQLSEQDFLSSIEGLIQLDKAWVPTPTSEESLYLRPFMFASDPSIGLQPATEVRYSVIATPAGPFFTAGVTGITLWVSNRYSRSARGGTGSIKCGSNYAAGMAPQREAQQHGCEQVLYLDSTDGTTLEECGAMNLFLVTAAGELVTPALGTILDGVTRATVLALADVFGLTPVERPITLDELRSGLVDGSVCEVFGTGTAAVITPIVGFRREGGDFAVGNGEPGKQTLALRQHLLDVQYGRATDEHGWMRRVL
ncbi:branched-chain amino acid aminotransferase [Streptomyces sp. NPDC059076]|uniref:branched-chain amino acid aminotransferase n=1 Tax=unclassified Streptomyces TaxID=2593676 RepID=UPI0036C2ACE0